MRAPEENERDARRASCSLSSLPSLLDDNKEEDFFYVLFSEAGLTGLCSSPSSFFCPALAFSPPSRGEVAREDEGGGGDGRGFGLVFSDPAKRTTEAMKGTKSRRQTRKTKTNREDIHHFAPRDQKRKKVIRNTKRDERKAEAGTLRTTGEEA